MSSDCIFGSQPLIGGVESLAAVEKAIEGLHCARLLARDPSHSSPGITRNCSAPSDRQALAFLINFTEWFFEVPSMHRVSKSFQAFVLSLILLVGGPLVQSLSAQDAKRSGDAPPYLGASEVAFEWQYSCNNGKACSFSCPGSGGASSVTKLTLQLGSIPLGGDQKAFGVFYKFSTLQIPRANGFSLTTGISTLSCQVVGMDLDYSGPRKPLDEDAPRKSLDDNAPTASIPSRERGPQVHVR